MRRLVHLVAATAVALSLLAVTGCGWLSSPESLMAKAHGYREKGDRKAAIIELKGLLQKHPEHGEARYLLGVTLSDAGDYLAAEQELKRARDLKVDPARVIPAYGRALVKAGKLKEALEELRLDPSAGKQQQATVLTLQGRALLGLGRSADATELFEKALTLHPELSDALLGQALLAMRARKIEEATKLLERAIASAPKSVDAWMLSGAIHEATADRDGAMAAYRKVLELDKDNIEAHVAIARMQIATRALADARKQIERINKIAPGLPLVQFLRAQIEYRDKKFPAAREAVLAVLKVSPDYMPAVLLAGAVEYALGSHAQAQSHLATVLKGSPGNFPAQKLMIASLAASGHAARALEMLQRALDKAPDDGSLLLSAGELYLKNNEPERAIAYLEKAASIDPKNVAIRRALGLSRFAAGETERGLAELESVVKLDLEDYSADLLLVLLNLRRANFDQALQAMQSLEKKQPNNPLTYDLKGTIYQRRNDGPAARNAFERALELQPTYVAAATNLAELDLKEKNPKAARRRVESVLEKDPKNAQALLSLAALGQRIGASDQEQLEWLERARTASPQSVQPLMMLARFHVRVGNVGKYLEAAQQLQALIPDDPEVLELLSSAQMAAGERNTALSTLQRLVGLQPKSSRALYLLGQAQSVNGDNATAANSLRKALALTPDFGEAHVALAGIEVGAGRFQEAIKIARRLQELAPKQPVGYVIEGDALTAEGKFAHALKALQTAFELGKTGLLAAKLHAAYAKASKVQEGDAHLMRWFKEAPDDAVARLYYAELTLRTSRFAQAIEQYEWLRRKMPDNASVLNNLAWGYYQVKDPRALEVAERAHKLQSDNPAIADTLGSILVDHGKIGRGLELLQGAVKAAPDSPGPRFHLAQALAKAGEKAQALSELKTLLATDSKFPQRAEAVKMQQQLSK